MTRVKEPSKYGVIVYQEKSGQIDRFLEKPQEYVGNKINAGLYLFSANILKRMPVARFDRRSHSRILDGRRAAEGLSRRSATPHSWLSCIVGKRCTIGPWVHMENVCEVVEKVVDDQRYHRMSLSMTSSTSTARTSCHTRASRRTCLSPTLLCELLIFIRSVITSIALDGLHHQKNKHFMRS